MAKRKAQQAKAYSSDVRPLLSKNSPVPALKASPCKGSACGQMRLVQSSRLRKFKLPVAAGGRAGFFLLAPFAFEALGALSKLDKRVQDVFDSLDGAIRAIQDSIAEPLEPKDQRLISGNRIMLRIICWIISFFPRACE